MTDIEKTMSFYVFQAHCGERRFKYAGKAGFFEVSCIMGSSRCNKEVCPIWNSTRVKPVNGKKKEPEQTKAKSLREINLELKNG